MSKHYVQAGEDHSIQYRVTSAGQELVDKEPLVGYDDSDLESYVELLWDCYDLHDSWIVSFTLKRFAKRHRGGQPEFEKQILQNLLDRGYVEVVKL